MLISGSFPLLPLVVLSSSETHTEERYSGEAEVSRVFIRPRGQKLNCGI